MADQDGGAPTVSATDERPVELGMDDRSAALDVLTSAFFDDPVERWLYPDEQEYLTAFPRFVAALGGRAFAHQTAWASAQGDAVALWLPPGVEPDDDEIVTVVERTVAPSRHADTFAVMEQMAGAHPAEPHWYLAWLGVRRSGLGGGHGGRLLATCLGIVDQSHLPAYLETPNPRTVDFYRRHGFEVAGQAQAGACPPLTTMFRAAH